jgi:DNA-binding NarL/FixJ family response regulator
MLKIDISIVPAAKKRARILIVDDQEILRQGVRSLLGDLRPEWQVCGEAADGDTAVSLAHALEPDLVVLDFGLPRTNGLQAVSRLRKMGLKTPVLVFTIHESDRLAEAVRAAGAQGYIVKSQATRDLVQAIETILSGGNFFGREAAAVSAAQSENR